MKQAIENLLSEIGITFQAEREGIIHAGQWAGSTEYSVTFHNLKSLTSYSLKFYMGSAHKTGPDAITVLHSLEMDAGYADYSFEEFCSELGYDDESRKAYATWEAVRNQTEKYNAFFDEDTRAKIAGIVQDY